MMKTAIINVPVDSDVLILGHTFSGLDDIRKAVEVSAAIETGLSGNRHIRRFEPQKPVPGIHVAELYDPYPCFDSDDYASESREYLNFFFSTKPFTDAAINGLAQIKHRRNSCMVTEEIPASALPAAYYAGDGNSMLIATVEP